MTNSRPPVTDRDVAGAGALRLSVNAICAAVGAGIGALSGAVIQLMLLGFFLGIRVVAERSHDL
jgi:hypothetical protein